LPQGDLDGLMKTLLDPRSPIFDPRSSILDLQQHFAFEAI
jgi:hypothetical protein